MMNKQNADFAWGSWDGEDGPVTDLEVALSQIIPQCRLKLTF